MSLTNGNSGAYRCVRFAQLRIHRTALRAKTNLAGRSQSPTAMSDCARKFVPDFPVGESGEPPLTVDGSVDGFLTVLPAPDALLPPGVSAGSFGPSASIGPVSGFRTFFDVGPGFNLGRDLDEMIEVTSDDTVLEFVKSMPDA